MSTTQSVENKPSVAIAQVTVTSDELPLRFPPFPTVPDGVAILPFKNFKAVGYKRIVSESGEEVEVDAYAGLPTIKVQNEKEASQKKKDKKKRKTAGQGTDENGRLVPWWEEWEEGENLRTMSVAFDGNTSYVDRVHQAADDFRVGRNWPEIAYGVRIMWDHFRLYIGLLTSVPVYKKTKSRSKGEVNAPTVGEEASDDEDDAPKAAQTNVTIVQDYLEQAPQPGKELEPVLEESSAVAKLFLAFIDDVEKTVKTFLTSHMHDTGLIWTDRNLFIAPTVLHFFTRFMLRNKVFHDSPTHLENLRRAVAVTELATKEMPLTARIGQILPGQLDLACKECWGMKGSLSIQIQISSTFSTVEDTPADDQPPSRDHTTSAFEEELKSHHVEVVPSDVVLDSVTAKQVLEDNLDPDQPAPVTSIPMTGDPWTAAIAAEEYTTSSWTDVSVPSLLEFLGPTILPLLFSPGIVEFSARRIHSIHSPKTTTSSSVVELELERRFARIVMEPWIHSDTEQTRDFSRPIIAPQSRGAVTAAFAPDNNEVTEDVQPHDPYNDNITLLVDPSAAEQLCIGMGLCGTWVEIRQEGDVKRRPGESYWYIESLVSVFPSFYTESDIEPDVSVLDPGVPSVLVD